VISVTRVVLSVQSGLAGEYLNYFGAETIGEEEHVGVAVAGGGEE
jgi:hypothetical protein